MNSIYNGTASQTVIYNDFAEERARKGCRSMLWMGGLLENALSWTHEHCPKRPQDIDSGYWPSNSSIPGDPTAFLSPMGWENGAWEIDMSPRGAGHIFPYYIRGQIFASDGVTPVGNAIIKMFNTATDTFVRQTVSTADGTGQFTLGCEDNTTQHYLVVYRAGPDIEGTSVNTLVGS